jgi:hypothetical protein
VRGLTAYFSFSSIPQIDERDGDGEAARKGGSRRRQSAVGEEPVRCGRAQHAALSRTVRGSGVRFFIVARRAPLQGKLRARPSRTPPLLCVVFVIGFYCGGAGVRRFSVFVVLDLWI